MSSDGEAAEPTGGEAQGNLDLSILRDDVGFQIHITRRALWQALRARRKGGKAREPSGYNSALILIGANPDISQSEIAEVLFLDAPNLALIMKQMTAAGLVERTQDQTDRRRFALRLTRAGERRLNATIEANRVQKLQIAHGLTKTERQALIALLTKVQLSLRNQE